MAEGAAKKEKKFAILVDPDKAGKNEISRLAERAENLADFFFIGGSLLTKNNMEESIQTLKKISKVPVLIFPGNVLQVSPLADGILFLSLISGRNPEMLIGKHVISAPYIRQTGLEVLPTGYMLIESGKATAVSYMSGTTPIPQDKNDIAMCTAMAGEMLGLKLIFMDAGSGAENPVSTTMIADVKSCISIPLICGGGINSPSKASATVKAGADIVVVGNALEKDPMLLEDLSAAVRKG